MACTKKSIKFLLLGDAGVGKSSLISTYFYKLSLVYHEHRYDKRRYQIEMIEILTFEELKRFYIYENEIDDIVNILCFNVTDRKSLYSIRHEWIPEILKLKKNPKMFLLGLQCDRREQFLTKLTQNCSSNPKTTEPTPAEPTANRIPPSRTPHSETNEPTTNRIPPSRTPHPKTNEPTANRVSPSRTQHPKTNEPTANRTRVPASNPRLFPIPPTTPVNTETLNILNTS
ncbi:ras-like GTP-binding protein RHO1 [Musca autumnalis]|uniref:ras-like GTP-binding protein RHO1 n=1 Tax=Musca autumnalis TaxID=221902 RepID=UPI003CEC7222